jgi:hypothetical protein
MNTIGVIHVAAVLVVLLALAFGLLLRGLVTPKPGATRRRDAGEFSAKRYRPMLRLLNEEDFEFLQSRQGYDEKLARQLRKERRRIFRRYLDQLSTDFREVHRTARWMLLTSPEPLPELQRILLEQQLEFTRGMMRVRVRLLAHSLGLTGLPTLDVRKLVDAFEAVEGRLALAAMSARS